MPPTYTADQRAATGEIDRNLQIIACAGSGKTQVTSERVVEILRRAPTNGIKPENVVAFAFTDRAAAELKGRIAALVGAGLGDIPGMAEVYVGTIHGYCLHLLQTHLFEYLKYLSRVPCHTTLETSFAGFLDGAKDVVRYMKNEFFGFSVTYYENGRPRQYSPDFIVVVRGADGNEEWWLAETKGEIRPNTAVKREAATLWCEK